MSKFWLLGVIFLLSSTGWGVTYQVVVPGKAVLAQGRQEVDLKKHSVGDPLQAGLGVFKNMDMPEHYLV